jgi:hypothetical protein
VGGCPHAADHVHLVATLARQDDSRPRIWNDFYRVREACQDAEKQLGLRPTAPADRTAARRPSRAETEQSARRGWDEPGRVRLRREVCTAAAAARSENGFFTRLAGAGVSVRKRYSTTSPGEVTGYAVGLPSHTARDGGIVWYGGGKLAADLTLPRLRRRWPGPGQEEGTFGATDLSDPAARAVLRSMVTGAARQAHDEAGFFAGLREAGVLVRLRFSQANPGQVTGYSVGLLGHRGPDGAPVWFGGGRLAADLTLPRLRRRWRVPRNSAERSGAFRFTVPERNAIFEHAARQAGIAAEHIRLAAQRDPAAAADAAWATADVLHIAARALRSPDLRRTADSYDRAARERYGRVPRATRQGSQLRATARMLSLAGQVTNDSTLAAAALIANLAALAIAVTEMRAAQQLAAQATAARVTAEHLRAIQPAVRARERREHAHEHPHNRVAHAAELAREEFGPDLQHILAKASKARRPRQAPGLPALGQARPGGIRRSS